MNHLHQGLGNLLHKGQIVNIIIRFVGRIVSGAATQLCGSCMKTAIDDMNWCTVFQ